MQKMIRLICLAIFSVALAASSYATSLPPQGVYEVRAKVLKVSEETVRTQIFNDEYEDNIMVKMTIEIQKILSVVGKADGKGDAGSTQYKPGNRIELTVVRRQGEFVDPKTPFHVGDIIVGNIERIGGWAGGDEKPFEAFNMTNIRILKTI
jgi:hypothetical protein